MGKQRHAAGVPPGRDEGMVCPGAALSGGRAIEGGGLGFGCGVVSLEDGEYRLKFEQQS